MGAEENNFDVNLMKIIKCLFLFICLSFVLASYSQEVDLNWVKTYKDAESCYWNCKNVLLKSKVSKEEVLEANRTLYWLGRRLGMYDFNFNQKVTSDCKIVCNNDDERWDIELLMDRIACSYVLFQNILIPYKDYIKWAPFWLNIESEYMLNSKTTKFWTCKENIILQEFNIGGMMFCTLVNTDEYFAYDVIVYHKEKRFNKKRRKYYYTTYERKITVMPNSRTSVSSSFSVEGSYFSPSSFSIVNKYYIGNNW